METLPTVSGNPAGPGSLGTATLAGHDSATPAATAVRSLTADGEILTNAHVVADATSITVTLYGESGQLTGLIRTDAAISSGNSGGPLVDSPAR